MHTMTGTPGKLWWPLSWLLDDTSPSSLGHPGSPSTSSGTGLTVCLMCVPAGSLGVERGVLCDLHGISALPPDFGSVMETLTPLGPCRDGELHPAGSACPDPRLPAELPPQPRLVPGGNLPHCRGPCAARVPPHPHSGSSFPPGPPSKHTPSPLRGSQLAKAG